ncbi:MAG TPA: dethiobiotin synthase [Gammaproteobacteria bacterium]
MINSPHPNSLPYGHKSLGGEGTLKKPNKGFFITGTDTGVGKTRISLAVMRVLQQQGLRVAAMKPVASGCEMSAEGLRNEDALLLQQHASAIRPYDLINPYAFAPPIAPHLAAARSGVTIEFSRIIAGYQQLAAGSDGVVVEGAGGWLVPLNDTQSIADLALTLKLPVILVVAIRLGCINHALLSAQAIRSSGCVLAGWIANHTQPADGQSAEIVSAIKQRIAAPLLGDVTYQPELEVDRMALSIDSTALRKACERE